MMDQEARNATDANQVTQKDVGTETALLLKTMLLKLGNRGISAMTNDAGRSRGSLELATAYCQSYLKCRETCGGEKFITLQAELDG